MVSFSLNDVGPDGCVEGKLTADIWSSAGRLDDPETEAAALTEELLYWHGALRHPDFLADFCRELPAGRVLLYGAGSLTRALLRRAPANIQVVGVIDRMAADLGEFEGVPVLSPAQAATASFDYVLLAHNVYEMEMRQSLLAVGVPAERIIAAHADARYRALTAGATAAVAAAACRRPVDAVMITYDGPGIIADRQIAEWLPPDRTICFYLGRGADAVNRDGIYETVDLQESLDVLKTALSRLRPRVVYVRTVLYKNYVGMMVKSWSPSTVVVQEFYDFSVLWPDGDLARLFGLNAASTAGLRRAELIAAHTLDMAVSKRGGDEWRDVWSGRRAPYRMIFPQITTSEDDGDPPAPIGDLVYAGFLPSPSFLRAFPVGYNFLPLLEQICRDGSMTAEIFNVSHKEDCDDIFADYLRDYAEPPIIYRRRIGYQALLKRMRGHRYGWLCNDQRTFHPDRRVGVCNRWTGYVSAGLPTLADSSWGFMGDLIREYGAGIVFDRLDAATMIDALRSADHTALTAGTVRLRARLTAHNAVASAEVGAVLERGLAASCV